MAKAKVGFTLEANITDVQQKLAKLSADFAQLRAKTNNEVKNMHANFGKFGEMIKRVGGAMAAAFSVSAIANFTKESMKLAAAAEGVKSAFAKIAGSERILQDIKSATRGTIEDSDLMALAIKAKNFGVPLKDLARLLEFATNRAIQTGGSITELTEKIVQGVGRRAPKSFIALGISADAAKTALSREGLTGIMELVNAEMAKMGNIADTASVRYDSFTASVTDLKEAWGEFLNNAGLVKTVIGNATEVVQRFSDRSLSFFQKMMMSGKDYKAYLEEKSKDIPEWMLPYAGKGTMLGDVYISPIVKDLEAMKKDAEKAADALKKLKSEYGEITKHYSKVTSFVEATTPSTKGGGLATWGWGRAGAVEGEQKSIETANEAIKTFTTLGQVFESTYVKGELLTDAFTSIGEGIENLVAGTTGAIKGMITSMLEAIRRIVNAYLAEAIAATIAKNAKLPWGMIGAAVGISAVLALWKSKVPAFASGTNFAPGGLSLVGERGPELVNLPRGSQVIPMRNQKMTIEVVGKLKAKDIQFALSRYNAELYSNT